MRVRERGASSLGVGLSVGFVVLLFGTLGEGVLVEMTVGFVREAAAADFLFALQHVEDLHVALAFTATVLFEVVQVLVGALLFNLLGSGCCRLIFACLFVKAAHGSS